MAVPFGIEPPRWLQDQVSWYRESGERSTQNLVQSYFQGANLALKQQESQLGIASGVLDLQSKQQALDLNKFKIASLSKDMEDIPRWLQEHPTWESRQNAEWPMAVTPEWEKRLDSVRVNDSRSIQAKTAVESVHAFSGRVAALGKSDPLAAGQFSPYIGKPNVSPDILTALSFAEESVKVAQENKSRLAEIESAKRGDVPTTTISEKGVSTTYRPAPSKPTDETPKTMTLDGGTTLAWVPGSKAIHVIKDGSKQEFTPFQLSSIARGLDSKDPRKKQITDFLANTAVAQTTPKTDTPAAVAPAAEKVRMLNPQGVPGLVPADQVEAAKAAGYKLP